MKIIYLNKGKAKKEAKGNAALEWMYKRDIRAAYLEFKERFEAAGITEEDLHRAIGITN